MGLKEDRMIDLEAERERNETVAEKIIDLLAGERLTICEAERILQLSRTALYCREFKLLKMEEME